MSNLRQCDKCGKTETYTANGEGWEVLRGKDLCPRCDDELNRWLETQSAKAAEREGGSQ